MRAWRSASVMAAVVILVTGCGSSSKKAADTTSTTAAVSTSAPATSSTIDKTADEATARALLVVAADLPAGWKEAPHDPDPAEDAAGKQLAACVGARDPSTDTADVHGSDFSNGDAQVSSSVSMAPTVAGFVDDMNHLSSPKLAPCLEMVLKTVLQASLQKDSPGATIGDVALSKLSMKPIGEAFAAYRVTIQVKANDQMVTVYDDSIQYGKGRSEVTIDFTNPGSPFDAAVESAVVAKAAARLGTSS